jgi:hypothetical protein
MIIRRHKVHEHRSTENCAYHSTGWRRNKSHRRKTQDPGSVAKRKAADVVAALKQMETVRSVANERWIVIGPRLRPIATTNIPPATNGIDRPRLS